MSTSPTIRDIATKLGVGKSTVQRALADLPGISAATRKRIKATAETLGYRPDPVFSSLAMHRSRSRKQPLPVAYLISKNVRGGFTPTNDVKVAANALGYEPEMIDPADLGAGKRLMEVLYHRGYIGVLVGPVHPSWHEAILANTRLPLVCCGRVDPLPLHTVQPDITNHVRVIWRQMRNAGYRRIGPAITQHSPILEDDVDRLGAILACQDEISKKDRISPFRGLLSDRESFVQWYLDRKPDAVLGFSVGQYYTLLEHGVDMSKVGFACLHAPKEKHSVDIAGTMELNNIVARESVHLLDQFIRHRTVGLPEDPLHLLIPGRWKAGASLPQKAPK